MWEGERGGRGHWGTLIVEYSPILGAKKEAQIPSS
jgi:hypothetical protein